jgi:hypothetical protein
MLQPLAQTTCIMERWLQPLRNLIKMTTEIGVSSNDINFALAVGPEPLKPIIELSTTNQVNDRDHGIVSRGPKPGKAAAIREYEQALEARYGYDIYAAWKDGSGLVCFAQYNCGDRSAGNCLGFVFDGPYRLVCDHCLEQKIKEKENVI